MTGRTHDAIAFASLITIASLSPPETLNLTTGMTCIVANIFGATLPDIDQASNRLWDNLPFSDHLSKVLSKIFMGHRNFTHSFIGIAFFYKFAEFAIPRLLNPSYIDGYLVFLSFLIGYISHLIGDAVTKDGLPLLFPLDIRFGIPPIKFFRIRAGGWIENLIILPGVGAYVFWFLGYRQNQLIELIALMV